MKSLNSSDKIVQNLFHFLNEHGGTYAVLGDTSKLPKIETDLDLCARNYLDFLSVLKKFSISEGFPIFNFHCHATGISFKLAATNGRRKLVILQGPDLILFPTWRIKGSIGLCFGDLLKSRKFDRRGFFVPSSKDAFIFYLVKKIDKGNLTAHQGAYLSRVWTEDPDGIEKTLDDMWPPSLSAQVTQAAKTGFWGEVNLARPELQKHLQKKSTWNLPRIGWILKRLIQRIAFPPGLHIAVLGPDGSGKTSVIDQVIQTYTPAFNGAIRTHLRPRIFYPKTQEGMIVVAPHAAAPRGMFSSVVKIFYFLFDYTFGYFARILPAILRNRLVVFDRYYHDLLVDPKRYLYGGPMWLAQLVGRLIPKPDLWILLDAPAEVLQQRKQEVPFEETARQRQDYLNLVKGFRNAVVIDASQPLDKVVGEVNSTILNFMEKRTWGRLGK